MDATVLGLALGGAVGFILALTGAGGGILAVPLLVFGLHMSLKQAAPVGLIAVGLSAGVGAVLGLREGIVRYRAAALIGSVGMLFAPVGLWLAQRLPNAPLTIGFSVVLLYTAWRTYRQSLKPAALSPTACAAGDGSAPDLPCLLNSASGRIHWTMPCARALAATGMVSGVLSGMLGAGGGFVIVPALTRNTNLAAHSILATSLAVITLVSASGVFAASMGGMVAWDIAAPFGLGAVGALLAGRVLARRLKGARLLQAFAAVSAAVSVLLFAKGCGWLL